MAFARSTLPGIGSLELQIRRSEHDLLATVAKNCLSDRHVQNIERLVLAVRGRLRERHLALIAEVGPNTSPVAVSGNVERG